MLCGGFTGWTCSFPPLLSSHRLLPVAGSLRYGACTCHTHSIQSVCAPGSLGRNGAGRRGRGGENKGYAWPEPGLAFAQDRWGNLETVGLFILIRLSSFTWGFRFGSTVDVCNVVVVSCLVFGYGLWGGRWRGRSAERAGAMSARPALSRHT